MLRKIFRKQPWTSGGRPGTRGKKPVKPELLANVIQMEDAQAVADWLAETSHLNRDSELSDLPKDAAQKLAEQLTPATGEELLGSVSPYTSLEFLRAISDTRVGALLDAVDSDVATRIVDLMEEDEAQAALHSMAVSHATVVRGLLAWPDESAASRMRAEYVSVLPDATVREAVKVAREESEDIETGVFVAEPVGAEKKVLGWLSTAALLEARSAHSVTEAMTPLEQVDQWSLPPLADQEAIAQKVWSYNAQVVPIIEDGDLLGVISLEQAREVAREEATEDAELQGGSQPLDVPYLKATPGLLWKKRVGWLLILFVAEMYTGTVLRAFEDELEAVVALSFFIPLLIGTGGNVGTQITTTLIRAMGQGEVRLRDLGRVIRKELSAAMLLAVTMGVAGAARAWTLGVVPQVIFTVAVALACIVVWASTIASALPLLLKKLHVDPAVVSGPMIATIVDGTGLMIYFYIAKIVLGL